MKESFESVSSGREALLNLEAVGLYLFHGSDNPDINCFEPRQAYNIKEGIRGPDGNPAVFASDKADYAILKALISEKNCPKGHRSSVGTTDTEEGSITLRLKASNEAVEQLNDESFGYVYVFEKNSFVKISERRVEYKSEKPVRPIDIIRVTKNDLPPYLEVSEY